MFTNVTTLAARPCESRRSGTAASRLWAAAGVSSDLAGGVKAPCPISKLPENEADTVWDLGSPSRLARFSGKSILPHPLKGREATQTN